MNRQTMKSVMCLLGILLFSVGCKSQKPEAVNLPPATESIKDTTNSSEVTDMKEAIPATTSASKLILSTTTSTQDSGLLDVLIPAFEKETNIQVDVIAKGTGAALKMGEDGEADVLLVHAKASEEAFMAAGNGVERSDVMYNDFILVGPPEDPAKIKADFPKDIEEALQKIKELNLPFISRADKSGTNTKELELWGDQPYTGENYIEAGKGMGDVLTMASEKKAYTLSDRATYLAMKDKLELEVVCEGNPKLFNQYGVITVRPDKNEKINYEDAKAFYDWIISEKAQEFIRNYGIDKYGQSLFIPNAPKQ